MVVFITCGLSTIRVSTVLCRHIKQSIKCVKYNNQANNRCYFIHFLKFSHISRFSALIHLQSYHFGKTNTYKYILKFRVHVINYDLLLFYREIRLFWKRFIWVFFNYRTNWRINAKVIERARSFLPRKFFTSSFSSPSFAISPNAVTSAYMLISDSPKRTTWSHRELANTNKYQGLS